MKRLYLTSIAAAVALTFAMGAAQAQDKKELVFVVNGASPSGLGLGGQGYLSYSIATPTGEGITTPLTFTRYRRVMMTGSLRMI